MPIPNPPVATVVLSARPGIEGRPLYEPLRTYGRGKQARLVCLSRESRKSLFDRGNHPLPLPQRFRRLIFYKQRVSLWVLLGRLGLTRAGKYGRTDLINATGWKRSKVQRAFRRALQRWQEQGQGRLSLILLAAKRLEQVASFELGGTDPTRELGPEETYCPQAAFASLAQFVRREPEITLDVDGAAFDRFCGLDCPESDPDRTQMEQKAITEWHEFFRPVDGLITVLKHAGISEIPWIGQECAVYPRPIATLFKTQNPVVWEALYNGIKYQLYWLHRDHLELVQEVLEACHNWRHVWEKSLPPEVRLRLRMNVWYENRVTDFVDTDALSDDFEVAHDPTATAIAFRRKTHPPFGEREKEALLGIIRGAQATTPHDPDRFTEDINAILEFQMLRVGIVGSDALCRLRSVPSRGNGKPMLQLTEGNQSRGFVGSELELVEVIRGPRKGSVMRPSPNPTQS